jgi:carbamoyltransferase
MAFYDKPILKFHRILETYFSVAPSGLGLFMRAVPLWLREKLWIEPRVQEELRGCGVDPPERVYFPEHHESHAATPSIHLPFPRRRCSRRRELATATLGVGEGRELRLLQQISFPHSLGLLYSAFTYFTGFRVNSAEYKLMGLAPYGEGRYTGLILEHLLDLKEDGSLRLNMEYFGYLDDLVMTSHKFEELFGRPPRQPESPITQQDVDIAKSIQEVTRSASTSMPRGRPTASSRTRSGRRRWPGSSPTRTWWGCCRAGWSSAPGPSETAPSSGTRCSRS